jgi:hypothetical protein
MIPSLLITTSATELEKSIEKGGALSGRLNTADGRNHLADSLDNGLPYELAHTAVRKGCGSLIPAATDTDVIKKKKIKKSVSEALDDIEKSFKRETLPRAGSKVHKPQKDDEEKREERVERKEAGLFKGGAGSGPQLHSSNTATIARPKQKDTFKEAEDMVRKQRIETLTNVFAKKPSSTPQSGAVSKALLMIIDPSKDKKDPLLEGGHSEQFHPDADKETVDFLTQTGVVNTNDPIHNPPVTPEINGFPLAVPMIYCSLSAGDLLRAEEKKSLMQKAFNW